MNRFRDLFPTTPSERVENAICFAVVGLLCCFMAFVIAAATMIHPALGIAALWAAAGLAMDFVESDTGAPL